MTCCMEVEAIGRPLERRTSSMPSFGALVTQDCNGDIEEGKPDQVTYGIRTHQWRMLTNLSCVRVYFEQSPALSARAGPAGHIWAKQHCAAGSGFHCEMVESSACHGCDLYCTADNAADAASTSANARRSVREGQPTGGEDQAWLVRGQRPAYSCTAVLKGMLVHCSWRFC